MQSRLIQARTPLKDWWKQISKKLDILEIMNSKLNTHTTHDVQEVKC